MMSWTKWNQWWVFRKGYESCKKKKLSQLGQVATYCGKDAAGRLELRNVWGSIWRLQMFARKLWYGWICGLAGWILWIFQDYDIDIANFGICEAGSLCSIEKPVFWWLFLCWWGQNPGRTCIGGGVSWVLSEVKILKGKIGLNSSQNDKTIPQHMVILFGGKASVLLGPIVSWQLPRPLFGLPQVQNGSARLMLDATTHKKLVGTWTCFRCIQLDIQNVRWLDHEISEFTCPQVRVVDVVLLRLYSSHQKVNSSAVVHRETERPTAIYSPWGPTADWSRRTVPWRQKDFWEGLEIWSYLFFDDGDDDY